MTMSQITEELKRIVPDRMCDCLPDSPLVRGAVSAGMVLFGTKWLLTKMSNYKEYRCLANNRQKAQEFKKSNIEAMEEVIRKDPDAQRNKDVVTKYPPLELVEKIKNKEYTALQVLRAYQAKALDCEKRTNAVCYFFDAAERWAMECDANEKKEGKFFGLPISIKDHFWIEGYDTTYGCAKNIGVPSTVTSVIVKAMRREGAVPFVRTNVPQLMLSFESCNPIYGRTRNPHDPTRGPGGSSSGEGAMVGYGASPLGLGSDLGGSVRVPAAFCGCCGFKPTTYRISKRDNPRFNRGQTAIDETYGPLAPDVNTIVEFCKAIWDNDAMFMVDTKIPPLMFNHQVYESKRPLRIGMYLNIGTQDPVPAVYRAMDIARRALESQGHTVVPWTPPEAAPATLFIYSILMAHEGETWLNNVRNDLLDPSIAHLVGDLDRPRWYKLMKATIQRFYDPLGAFVTHAGAGIRSALGYWNKYEELQDYRDKVSDAWQDARLDVCIGPAFPFPPMPSLKIGDMSSEKLLLVGATYTILYNVLCQPAGVVPVTKVTTDDVENMKDYPKTNKLEESIHLGMQGAAGLPLPCQVIGLRFRDEIVLRVMKELESGLKNV